MPKPPLNDNKDMRSKSEPSYTYPNQEQNKEPQEQLAIAASNHHEDFDPVRSWEELQQFLFSLRPPVPIDPLSLMFIPRPSLSRHNPILMLKNLILITAVNGNLALATDDNRKLSHEEPSASPIADNNILFSTINPPPSSPLPADFYGAVSSLTGEDRPHDFHHEEKQLRATLSDEPLSLSTEISEKFSALLLSNKPKSAKGLLKKFQQENPHVRLNDIRDLKGRSLLEMAIRSDYEGDKIGLTKYLLDAGCDINAVDSEGRVFLSIAVAMPNPDKNLIALLLSKEYTINIHKRGIGSDENHCTALEVVINRLLADEDLFEIAYILADAGANPSANSTKHRNRTLFSLLDDVNNKEKANNLKDRFEQSALLRFKKFVTIRQIFLALKKNPLTYITTLIILYRLRFTIKKYIIKSIDIIYTIYNSRRLKIQLDSLSSFEKAFLGQKDSFVSLKHMDLLKEEIKKRRSEIQLLTKETPYSIPDSKLSCQELSNKIEQYMKEYCAWRIKQALSDLASRHEPLDSKEKKEESKEENIEKLQHGLNSLQKSDLFQNHKNQKYLNKTIIAGIKLLADIENLTKGVFLENLQILSAKLTSIISELPDTEESKPTKERLREKIATIPSLRQNIPDFLDQQKFIISCRKLLTEARDIIEKDIQDRSTAAQASIDTGIKNQRKELLENLDLIEESLLAQTLEDAVSIKTRAKNLRKTISDDTSYNQQKLDNDKIARTGLLRETEEFLKKEQLPIIEKEIEKLKTQLEKDESGLLQATTVSKKNSIITVAERGNKGINNRIKQTDDLLSEAKNLYQNFSISRFNSLKEKLPKECVERLHNKTKKSLTQLKEQEKILSSAAIPSHPHKKEHKKLSSSERKPTGDAKKLTRFGAFSSNSESDSSSSAIQPPSDISSTPPKRNIAETLKLITAVESLYKNVENITASTKTGSLFQRYLQRGCLFFSLQSLLENMKGSLKLTGRNRLNKARNCLVHNLPLTDTVFAETEKAKQKFPEFVNLLQPLREGLIAKSSLHSSCDTAFSPENLAGSIIDLLNPKRADSKESSSPQQLTEEAIKDLIGDFIEGRSRFETSMADQNKSKLSYIASAFLAAELDSRIEVEMRPKERFKFKTQVDKWLKAVLKNGRDYRHHGIELLEDALSQGAPEPAESKRQESKPSEMDASTQSMSTQDSMEPPSGHAPR